MGREYPRLSDGMTTADRPDKPRLLRAFTLTIGQPEGLQIASSAHPPSHYDSKLYFYFNTIKRKPESICKHYESSLQVIESLSQEDESVSQQSRPNALQGFPATHRHQHCLLPGSSPNAFRHWPVAPLIPNNPARKLIDLPRCQMHLFISPRPQITTVFGFAIGQSNATQSDG